MAKKKEEFIIREVIELFNQEAVSRISIRDIAKKTNLSLGNITYYFPNKKFMLLKIYEHMKKNAQKAYLKDKKTSMTTLHEVFVALASFHFKYPFFYRDYAYLIHEYPSLKEEHKKTLHHRKEIIEKVLLNLISEKFASASFTLEVVERVTILLMIFFHSSASSTEIQQSISNEQTDEASNLVLAWTILMPYLSPKGKKMLGKLLDTY